LKEKGCLNGKKLGSLKPGKKKGDVTKKKAVKVAPSAVMKRQCETSVADENGATHVLWEREGKLASARGGGGEKGGKEKLVLHSFRTKQSTSFLWW